MSRINANSAQLLSVARELNSIANEIAQGRTQFTGARDETLNVWQSRITGMYNERAEGVSRRVNTLAEQVRTLARTVQSVAETVRRAEIEAERAARRRASMW